MYDHAVIGGGILGLATARELSVRHPGARIVVLEKESALARHQTGHNSGVIHAGVYYSPGSMKARLGVAGARSMLEFCAEHGIAHSLCGKVIVATDESELLALDELHRRASANGVTISKLSADEVHEIEPHVRCVAGLHSPNTGTADFVAVANKLAELLEAAGGEIRVDSPVTAINDDVDASVLTTPSGQLIASSVINCAGLQSDRVARMAGADPGLRIVPFRGEYYTVREPAAAMVRTLIYPVPDPSFPFLGVHLTRMLDGSVHAGPNAVLATKREGYTKSDFSARDVADTLSYGGFWRLARKYPRQGFAEVRRSLSKRAFVRSLRELVPELAPDDVVRASSGVRAQALMPDGSLADDFVIVDHGRSVHVCNAPSPAATASLEIARVVADRVDRIDA